MFVSVPLYISVVVLTIAAAVVVVVVVVYVVVVLSLTRQVTCEQLTVSTAFNSRIFSFSSSAYKEE